MDIYELQLASEKLGEFDNHKLIDLLKAQSLDEDATGLKEILNEIKDTATGKIYQNIKVNDNSKRFAELMLTQVSIKECTDKLSKIIDKVKELSITIAGLEITSLKDIDTRKANSEKELERLRKEATQIQETAQISLDSYRKVSNEISTLKIKRDTEGLTISNAKGLKQTDDIHCISKSSDYIHQCQELENIYDTTVKDVEQTRKNFKAVLRKKVTDALMLSAQSLRQTPQTQLITNTTERLEKAFDEISSINSQNELTDFKEEINGILMDYEKAAKKEPPVDISEQPDKLKDLKDAQEAQKKLIEGIFAIIAYKEVTMSREISKIREKIEEKFPGTTKAPQNYFTRAYNQLTGRIKRNEVIQTILNELTKKLTNRYLSVENISKQVGNGIKLMKGEDITNDRDTIQLKKDLDAILKKTPIEDQKHLNPNILRNLDTSKTKDKKKIKAKV